MNHNEYIYLIDLHDDYSEKIPYDDTDYPVYIRHAFLSIYPNYAAPPHWHDDIEFISVLEGEMNYNINGKTVCLHAGDGIFINTRQMHFGFSDSHTECEFFCVILHPLLLCQSPHQEREFVLPVLQNQELPYILLKPTTKWQKEIISKVNNIYAVRKDTASILKIQSFFLWIWSTIYEHMPKPLPVQSLPNSDLSILKNMIGYIQKQYADEISLQQISSAGGIGQSKCCKLFRQYLHQTPNAYLISYRLDKAANLLAKTNMTITEIAYATGFNGASYFAEIFRKAYHMSPSAYRQSKQ